MSETAIREMQPTPEDVAKFEDCFGKNGSPRRPGAVQWQFLESPAKALFVDFAATEDGTVGGIYASLPNFFQVDGERTLAVQSLDTLTDKEFRGRGLFKQLARSVFERCERDGCAFIYGFPNGNSAHGFFNRLGWASLDPVPFLIRPLRSNYFLAKVPYAKAAAAFTPDVSLGLLRSPKLPRGHSIHEVQSFEDFDVDAIWSEFSASFKVGLVRDRAYMKWRMSKPGENYRTLVYYEAGVERGFVTFAVKNKHGGRIGYVLELMHSPAATKISHKLLHEALHMMKAERADAALAWCLEGSANAPGYRRAGFLPFPEKLRPIELHFGVRALGMENSAVLEDRRNWYISYCDSDTV